MIFVSMTHPSQRVYQFLESELQLLQDLDFLTSLSLDETLVIVSFLGEISLLSS